MSDSSGQDEPAAEAAPEIAPPPPKRRKIGWVLLALLALIVIAGGGVVLFAPEQLPASLRPSQPAATGITAPIAGNSALPHLDAMIERVSGLESRVGKLQQQVTALAEMAQRNADLVQRLDQLEQKLAALAAAPGSASAVDLAPLTKRLEALERRPATAAPDNAAQEQQLAALSRRLDALTQKQTEPTATDQAAQQALAALQQKLAAQDQALAKLTDTLDRLAAEQSGSAAQMALVLAVQRLAEAAARSGGFADALKPVQALARDPGAETALKTLERLQGGVPSLPSLQTAFTPAASKIVRAAGVSNEGPWWQRSWDRLTSAVVIRRIGEVAGSEPDAVVARAERRLAQGDLAAAVSELEALRGPAAAAAAPWLDPARNRLAVDRAVDALQTAALSRLGQAGAGTK